MKITDVEAIILRQPTVEMIGDGSQDTLLIRVHTDEGIIGVGEVDSSPYICKRIIESPASHMVCMGLREVIIGQDPIETDKIWRLMYEKSLYYGRRSAAIHAMSGIDIALWDIVGKKFGQPVSKLLGGRYRERIKAYCSVLMPDTEDEVKTLIERHMPKGYVGLKLGWGALGQYFEKDIRLARCARKALGSDAYLMLDIGMKWHDVKGAASACKHLEESDVFWVEEPFGPDFINDYAELARHTRIRIAGGEELGTCYEYRELVERRAVDVIQPDLSRCGGFTVARRITDMADETNRLIVPHAFKTGILMAATLQYIASLPHAMFLEFCEQDTLLRRELTDIHFAIDADGDVRIPDAPGLGIEIDMETVNRYRVEEIA